MKNFAYFRPGTVDQAVALLEPRWGNTELLAGGTDLHARQKEYVAQPSRVVSLNHIKGFAGIETDNQNPPRRGHTLARNEVLVSVTVPVRGLASASYEVRHKQSYDWPLVHAAVSFATNNGKASGAKVVLGHVAPTPHVAEAAARALENR